MKRLNKISFVIYMLVMNLLIILCQAEMRYESILSRRTKRYGYGGFSGYGYGGGLGDGCCQCGMCGGGYSSYHGGYGMGGGCGYCSGGGYGPFGVGAFGLLQGVLFGGK